MTNESNSLLAELGVQFGLHRADRRLDADSQARHEPGLKDVDLCRVGCPHHTPDTYASRRAKHRRAPRTVAS